MWQQYMYMQAAQSRYMYMQAAQSRYMHAAIHKVHTILDLWLMSKRLRPPSQLLRGLQLQPMPRC
jgi:hypothetical protein